MLTLQHKNATKMGWASFLKVSLARELMNHEILLPCRSLDRFTTSAKCLMFYLNETAVNLSIYSRITIKIDFKQESEFFNDNVYKT
jgi:hypothetical protein